MEGFSFSTKFIKDYHLKYDLEDDEIAPQTLGMYWCMLATGINRIFTEDHLHEFLFRLAITMDSIQLVENWFGWDKLSTFIIKNKY